MENFEEISDFLYNWWNHDEKELHSELYNQLSTNSKLPEWKKELIKLKVCVLDYKSIKLNIFKYLEKMDQNNSDVILFLGEAYKHGKDVDQDYIKAFEYYTKAVEMGNNHALNLIGLCYRRGIGIERDDKKAIECYEKAIELGNIYALNNLGICYYNGCGVKQDFIKAIEYYIKAAELGNSEAERNLKNIPEIKKVKYKLYKKEKELEEKNNEKEKITSLFQELKDELQYQFPIICKLHEDSLIEDLEELIQELKYHPGGSGADESITRLKEQSSIVRRVSL